MKKVESDTLTEILRSLRRVENVNADLVSRVARVEQRESRRGPVELGGAEHEIEDNDLLESLHNINQKAYNASGNIEKVDIDSLKKAVENVQQLKTKKISNKAKSDTTLY